MSTKTTGKQPSQLRSGSSREDARIIAGFELSSRSFLDFLDWVLIMEPPQPLLGKAGGAVKFELWPHILEMALALTRDPLIEILKARQVGFSWTVSAYAVWLLRFRNGSRIMELSQGQQESKDLLSKAKFIYKHLPDLWQLPIAVDSASEFRLEGSDSRILALPSTEDAGRGETATLVIQDEAESHAYADENYLAVKPSIDTSGGQMVIGSTSKKTKAVSLFKNLYRGSPANGWKTLFIPWHARPGRDAKWYENIKRAAADLPEAQETGVALYMEQEYPSSSEEALAPSRAISAFDPDQLTLMLADTKPPVRQEGVINIYQEWQPRKAYCCGSDTGHGVGGDYSCSVIIDRDTGAVVAARALPPAHMGH
jgi:hypothetical protein